MNAATQAVANVAIAMGVALAFVACWNLLKDVIR